MNYNLVTDKNKTDKHTHSNGWCIVSVVVVVVVVDHLLSAQTHTQTETRSARILYKHCPIWFFCFYIFKILCTILEFAVLLLLLDGTKRK